MTQLNLLPSPLTPVWLRCPRCAYTWLAAYHQDGAWWMQGIGKVEDQCYCPQCQQTPPMEIAKSPDEHSTDRATIAGRDRAGNTNRAPHHAVA